MRKVGPEFIRPHLEKVEQIRGAYAEKNVFAHIVELVQIEQRAGIAHLLCSEIELIYVCVRVGDAPFFEVGIEYGQKILSDCRRVIPQVSVIV